MPKLLFARPPLDAVEERRIRKLAGARHAPADWIRRAQMIALSWDGLRVPAIARALGCSQKAVRYRLARFAAEGLDGLGDRPGPGRKPRISQAQRSQLIALVGGPRRSGVRPKRTRVVGYYTHPPPDTTVIAADELGPVTPRTFDPPPGWTADGHRVKAPLTYSRGPEKTWIYGGLRISDGQAVTCCAPSRDSASWQAFLARLEQANPTGVLAVITDNLSSHSSVATRAWLAGHPRIEQVFIPKGACWLNLQEAWWRIFRRHALAGQTFADPSEIAQVTGLATAQLNSHAKPWVWGRPPPPPRLRRRRFIYLL